MTAYFKHLNSGAVNHNNQLRVIRVLLNFAQSKGYLPDTIDLLKAVSRKKTRKASYPSTNRMSSRLCWMGLLMKCYRHWCCWVSTVCDPTRCEDPTGGTSGLKAAPS